jgi:enterochelin esterase-like enzyme
VAGRPFDRLAVLVVTVGGEQVAHGHPGVTDAERVAAGRETLAARTAAVIDRNRSDAALRFGRPLPADRNHVRVWRPRDPEPLRGHLSAEDLAVWAEDGVLHVLFRGTATGVDVYGGIGAQLWPVAGTADLWEASVRIRDLDRATLTVCAAPRTGDDDPIGVPAAATTTWRGPRAPAAPPEVAEPAGSLVEHTVASGALGEPRTLTVYRPPGDHGPLPGCVLADGESTGSFARVLEPAILAGQAPPVVVVGIHNRFDPAAPWPDRRAQEYVPGQHRRRFAAHLRFVTDEVIGRAGREFDVTPHGWVAAGYSNGGAWAIAAAQRRPDVFTGVAAFSAGVVPRRISGAARRAGVRHYLAAGSLEDGFREATGGWAERVGRAGLDVRYEEWVGGHDPLWWSRVFPAAMQHLVG